MQRFGFGDFAQLHPDAIAAGTFEFPKAQVLGGLAVTKQAMAIMAELLKVRRMVRSSPDASCNSTRCPLCAAPHLEKIKKAIVSQTPVTFVLPAFPGKSPNPSKVLGPLPDMAEQRALQFLDALCRRIRQVYEPGARIILCSDGRVFSDVVGMPESDITAYQLELDRLIDEFNLDTISTFNLDELCDGEVIAGENLVRLRHDLMIGYGQPIETLREKVSRGGGSTGNRDEQDTHRLYCGITRFLFEDAMHPGQEKSRTAVQKDARIRAYEVIRRSDAWSELIAARYPAAVRLSIHPQACGSRKLGVQLLENTT